MYRFVFTAVLTVLVSGVAFAIPEAAGETMPSCPLSSSKVLNQVFADVSFRRNRPLSSSEVVTILERNLPLKLCGRASGGDAMGRGIDGADGMMFLGNRKISREELGLRVLDYMTPTETEVRQLFDFVRASSHIKSNPSYANIMKDVKFVYENKDNRVNSFSNQSPLICVKGGDARFSRLVGLAVAACKENPRAASRFLQALTPEACRTLGEEASLEIMAKANILYAFADDDALLKARGVSAGYLLFTIAHESGHISLAHVLGPDYKHQPLEISRNHEREADSFASSVIASCPFGEYIFTGRLFELYARACCESGCRETTHPLSLERLQNLIKENPTLAASFGITVDMFKDGVVK